MRKGIVLSALASAVTMLMAGTAGAYQLYWTPWVSEENGGPWTACRNWDEAAVGFGCSGSYCDNIRMLCETFNNGITLLPSSDYHTAWFSEEGAPSGDIGSTGDPANGGFCESTLTGTIDSFQPAVMSGAHCSGKYCDNMQLECDKPVKYDGAGTPVQATPTRCRTAGPFSDENGSQDFGANQYISSITCTGKYCDNLTFTVCAFTAPF